MRGRRRDEHAGEDEGEDERAHARCTLRAAPVGAGERLLENVGDPTLEPVKVVASPEVTHVKYRVVR